MPKEEPELCPKCDAEIPPGSPGGLCPKCLLDQDETPTVAVDPDSSDSGRAGMAPSAFSTGPKPPEQIGPYRILERIGEGGMGHVYVAEQRKPVRRKVAIKIIKPGMDSREVLARFDAERQALALMDHPNVSRVLDAGLMDNGRPYFVMDLVLGHPITEFCDRNHLSIEDRLELFFQVCQGVQHAHQKGVIHRDVKPSNVIVTVNNSQPIPKVIDFGIAKAMGSELTQQTYFTFAGQVVGTPYYMSPEQAESHASDVDTRSDIYSLGVMLHELLTGRTPLSKQDFDGLGLEEMLRTIREFEPVRPSTVLTRLDDETMSEISDSRGTGSRRLTHVLRGDLDWIVIKALEKDRSRRYETANALAADVRRYLRGEPVSASPPTVSYRVGKFVRRHKGPLFATSLITLSLLGGLGVSLYQTKKALEAEAEAKSSLRVAEIAEEKAIEAQRDTEVALAAAERAKEEADTARARTEEALKAAEAAEAEEKEQRREAEEQARKADLARKEEEISKQKAQQALADLREAIKREEEGKVLLTDLRTQVNTMLEFLRSEEIRKELQKKDPNGLDLVRSIDDRIKEAFPGVNGGEDFLEEDFRLSLLLGDSSIFSLESSLTTAESNYRSALQFHRELAERDESPGDLDLARIHHAIGRIASLRGRYDEAIGSFDKADSLLRGAAPTAEGSRLAFELLLDRAAARLRAGDSESALSAVLESDRILREASRGVRDPSSDLLLAGMQSLLPEAKWEERPDVLAVWLAADRSGEFPVEWMVAGYRAAFAREMSRVLALVENRGSGNSGELPGQGEVSEDEAVRIAAEREQENDAAVAQMLEWVAEIRELASRSEDRRLRMLELHSEKLIGSAYSRLGDNSRALEHYQRCVDRASDLLREDGEMAGPLEVQFVVGVAINEIYRDSSRNIYPDSIVEIFGESIDTDQGRAALDNAYQALSTIRRRGVSVDHLEKQVPELRRRMVEASVYQFYEGMSSPSALEENAVYAEEVLFFDELRDRSFILQEQLDYREKYPFRLFKVVGIEHLPESETGAFQVLATINWWMANPKKENRVDFDKAEGELTQKIGFAFDDSNRLRIVEMKNYP